MVKFCETCPLRGDCIANIDEAASAKVQCLGTSRLISLRGPLAVILNDCADIEGRRSEVFALAAPIDTDELLTSIENCDQPKQIMTRGSLLLLQRPRIIKVCGALGIAPNAGPYEAIYKNSLPLEAYNDPLLNLS